MTKKLKRWYTFHSKGFDLPFKQDRIYHMAQSQGPRVDGKTFFLVFTSV